MHKISSGLLMYKINDKNLKVFLVHHGGPFWKNKDIGAWSIPKGQVKEKEKLFDTAKREFVEETGIKLTGKNEFIPLGEVRQKSGKIVHAWAFENDWNGLLKQNIIEIEYPYNSGKKIKIPEVDKVKLFSIEEAKEKIIPAQREFIERLVEKLNH
ncbi:MAG: NUDIX domain-containing protein [archaeon]